jgi:hypothetical protein
MPSPEISEGGMIALETVIGDPFGRDQEGLPSPLRGLGLWGIPYPGLKPGSTYQGPSGAQETKAGVGVVEAPG